MAIKALLFDMDGVLIDAKDWHYEAFNRALSLFGYAISRYEHIRTFDGLPTKEKLRILSSTTGLPLSLHGFLNEMKQRYTMELIHTRCRPMFHHEYALSRLKAEGYKIAVCSNSIRETIETMMDYANLSLYMDIIISNQDVQRSKPDPQMYQVAMARLGVKPNECVVIEDNPNGIQAGLSSGAYVLQVGTVYDVNYRNIQSFISECNAND